MKYNFEYTKNDYMTPPELYQMALDNWKITRFSLDTCCSEKNIPAEDHYIFNEKDGLKEEENFIQLTADMFLRKGCCSPAPSPRTCWALSAPPSSPWAATASSPS